MYLKYHVLLSKASQGTEDGKRLSKFSAIILLEHFLSVHFYHFLVISLWDKVNNPHLIGISPFKNNCQLLKELFL